MDHTILFILLFLLLLVLAAPPAEDRDEESLVERLHFWIEVAVLLIELLKLVGLLKL